jgi:hypothetical protein
MRKPDGWNREAILADRNVAAWVQGNRLRSKVSADNDLRKLALLTHRIGTTPGGVVSIAKRDPDELAERLIRYATALKRKGRLDSYILKTFSGLKSWLRFRRTNFEQFPKLRAVQGISLRTETVPTQEQLGRILGALSVRGRAVALLMAHSGLRPGAIAHEGSTGLRIRDLRDLSLDASELKFEKSPFQITVPGELSKTSREYVTFGSEEEARAILTYLTFRKNAGERLHADSPLVAVAPHQSKNWLRGSGRTDSFVTTETLTFELRTGIRKVLPSGTRWRPYVLRSYCSSRLLSAENAGKITRDVREAILGHDLGVAGRYNLSKKLHPDQIEEMRAAYQRSEPFLSTQPTNFEHKELREQFKSLLEALVTKFSPEEAKHIADYSEQEQIDIVRRSLATSRSAAHSGSRGRQRVVAIHEVETMIATGYEFVAQLSGGRVVLQAPEDGPR